MTTREQDQVVEAYALEYGSAHVEPVEGSNDVRVAGFKGEAKRVSPWKRITEDGGVASSIVGPPECAVCGATGADVEDGHVCCQEAA